ncbi:MAG: alpha-isopropylmalate synthase regulatory domain-containing protein, partial [Nitratireductor sp.]
KANSSEWEVPYLPIDPVDVGRTYEAIIRINSQSGKGGLAYILAEDYGLKLPRSLQVEFRDDIQKITDSEGTELSAERIHKEFQEIYIEQPKSKLQFVNHETLIDASNPKLRKITASIVQGGEEVDIDGHGTGPIDSFVNALSKHFEKDISVVEYSEHSLNQGSDAQAICYMQVEIDGKRIHGVGVNPNIVTASLMALISAMNRMLEK